MVGKGSHHAEHVAPACVWENHGISAFEVVRGG